MKDLFVKQGFPVLRTLHGCPCIRCAFKPNSPPASPGMKRKTLLYPAHPAFVIPNVLSSGLHKAGAPVTASEVRRGQGHPPMWAGYPCSGLDHLSLAASLLGLLLFPTPQGPPGMGEKGSPRLYQSQETLQNGVLRGLFGAQLQGSQVTNGVRGQLGACFLSQDAK